MLLLSGDPISGLIWPDTLHETEFPKARSFDLVTQIRITAEKFRRLYPTVDLYVLKYGSVPDVDSSGNTSEGNVVEPEDGTDYDDLYGETIPAGYGGTLVAETSPHSDPSVNATRTGEYYDPVPVHVHINHNPTTKELKHYGIEEAHEQPVLVTFLLPELRELGLAPGIAAQFFWKRHWYRIQTYKRRGYWLNTSVHLYLQCACTLKSYGS